MPKLYSDTYVENNEILIFQSLKFRYLKLKLS